MGRRGTNSLAQFVQKIERDENKIRSGFFSVVPPFTEHTDRSDQPNDGGRGGHPPIRVALLPHKEGVGKKVCRPVTKITRLEENSFQMRVFSPGLVSY